MIGYHPDEVRPAADWLKHPARVRRAAVAAAHEAHGWDGSACLEAHAIQHDLVETAVARRSPAPVGRALRRLRALGVTRHDAIHALGRPLADLAWMISRGGQVPVTPALLRSGAWALESLAALPDAAPETLRRYVDGLGDAHLDEPLRAVVRANGPAYVAPLLAVLSDRRTWEDDAPGGGWAPIHAADLLAEIEDERAIEPLLDVFLATRLPEILHEMAGSALGAFWDRAVTPILTRAASLEAGELKARLLSIPIVVGHDDDRLRVELEALLDAAPDEAAFALDLMGHPESYARIREALARLPADCDPRVRRRLRLIVGEDGARVAHATRPRVEGPLSPSSTPGCR